MRIMRSCIKYWRKMNECGIDNAVILSSTRNIDCINYR